MNAPQQPPRTALEQLLADEIARRADAQQHLADYAQQVVGVTPALHHRYICDELERGILNDEWDDCVVCLPPGGAKSTYASHCLPSWFLGHFPDNNVSIWWGGVSNHTLVEISGVGCQLLRDNESMMSTIASMNERTTRLDVAVDFVRGVLPADFVAGKLENRFKVTQTNDEGTGLTQYVGSRKSDRFARCYVYHVPHPRAGILRVEHVMRGRYAKVLSNGLIESGIARQVAILGNTFGWNHPCWKPDEVTDGKLRAKRHDKDDASTLRWLIKAVAPSLAKNHTSGLIDLNDFIERHVMPLIDER